MTPKGENSDASVRSDSGQSAGMHVDAPHEPLVSSDGPIIEPAQRPGRVRTKRGAEIAWPQAAPSREPGRYRQWGILLAILLVAALPRLLGLDGTSLWGDEILCILNAQEPTHSTIDILARQNQPPGYHLFLGKWLLLFGPAMQGWGARLLSGLAGVAAILFTFLTARLLLGFRVALLATLLAATSLFWIIFAREATMYSPFLAMSMGTVYLFHHLVRRSVMSRASRFWIGWLSLGLLRVALLYTHYFAAFLILAEFIIAIYIGFLRRRPKITGAWLVAHIVCAAAFLPWLPVLVGQIDRVDDGFWTQPFSIGRFINLLRQFLLYLPEADHLPWILVFGLVAMVALYSAVQLLRYWVPFAGTSLLIKASVLLDWWFHMRARFSGTKFSAGATQTPRPRPFPTYEGINILLIYLVIGLGGALVASLLLTNLFEPKYLIPFSAFAYILLAAGCILLPSPLPLVDRAEQPAWRGAAAFTLFAAAQLVGLYLYLAHPGYRHPDLRGAREYISEHISPGDAMVALHPEGLAGLYFYSAARRNGAWPLYLYSPEGEPPFYEGLGSMPRSFFIDRADLTASGQERLWLLVWDFSERPWEDRTTEKAARMGLLHYWASVCGDAPLSEPIKFGRLELYLLPVTREFDRAEMMHLYGEWRQRTADATKERIRGALEDEARRKAADQADHASRNTGPKNGSGKGP